MLLMDDKTRRYGILELRCSLMLDLDGVMVVQKYGQGAVLKLWWLAEDPSCRVPMQWPALAFKSLKDLSVLADPIWWSYCICMRYRDD